MTIIFGILFDNFPNNLCMLGESSWPAHGCSHFKKQHLFIALSHTFVSKSLIIYDLSNIHYSAHIQPSRTSWTVVTSFLTNSILPSVHCCICISFQVNDTNSNIWLNVEELYNISTYSPRKKMIRCKYIYHVEMIYTNII